MKSKILNRKSAILFLWIAATLFVQAGSIKQDNLTLRVNGKSWSKQNGSYTTAPQGKKFVFIDVEIDNRRATEVRVSSYCFELIDRDGQTYNSTYCAKNDLDSVTLRKGTKAKGRLAFEVPYNATAKELIFEVGYKEELRLKL